MPVPPLPTTRASSRPATSRPHEPPAQSPRRAATPLVCRRRVHQGRPRRRYPPCPHHRPARRYHPPRPRRTPGRLARPPRRPHPPARRRPQGAEKKDPTLVPDLLILVEDVTGGDPQSGARFVRRGLETLSRELHELDHRACPATVAKLLREEDFALRVNRKRFTGPAHPDRDRQFRYLQGQLDLFRDHGWPVISVDAKKSELIGNFKNAGAIWCWYPEEVH